MWAFVDGVFVQDRDAVVSVHDRGFRYGDGVFDTLRVYRGQPFLIERHLARLIQGATALGIAPLPTASALASTIRDLADRNGTPDALVRTTVTRGVSPGWDVRHAGNPTVVVVEQPFAGYPDQLYVSGASIVILADIRLRPSALTPAIKSLSLLAHVQAKRDATDQGADEALLCTESGFVAEGTVSNVFCVMGGTLRTPPLSDGILQGITREVVLELCRRNSIPAVEDHITPDQCRNAEEVFLTSTGMEVLPVTRVDGHPIGSGQPGAVTLGLRRRYQEFVRETLGTR
ncbi:MAG TPA: aminotransferase class IV [Nitrospiria bacterium]|nr:aminotransferase class IV [Nitrospiria bacterium]